MTNDFQSNNDTVDLDALLTMMRRIGLVAQRTVWSMGFFKGANAVLLSRPDDGRMIRHVIHGFASDASMAVVIRIAALLERGRHNEKKTISFQVIYDSIKEKAVRDALVAHSISGEDIIFPDRQENAANHAIDEFIRKYNSLDWSNNGSIARLKNFRNLGVAHLRWDEVYSSIKFSELEFMARAVGDMAGALQFFTNEVVYVSSSDIDENAESAERAWAAAYDAS